MSNRTTWRFRYSSRELLAAVNKIVDHSNERLTHWKQRYEAAKVAAETTTVKVEVKTQEVTGGEKAFMQAHFDREPEKELDLSQAKMQKHRDRITEFERWARGFTANPEAIFELDPDDIAYFRL